MERCHRVRYLSGLLCILLLLGTQQPARAQESSTPDGSPKLSEWVTTATENSVTLAWQSDDTGRTLQERWPLAEIDGWQLPAQLFAFTATASTPPRLHIDSLTSQPTDGRAAAIIPVAPAIPQTIDGPPRPDLAVITPSALPDTPVTILRRGRMRGVELLVVAVTQRFAQNGREQTLTSITFSIDGARPLDTLPTPAALTARPLALDAVADPSPLTSQPRLRVDAPSAGMQEIRLDDLRALGFAQNDAQIARLQLFHDGQPVALEVAGDRLRFYALPPGDRWNANDAYWLLLGDEAGLRMASRAALSDAANALPISAQGWESGHWSAPALYDSTLAGADADHWFAADLRSGPELQPITLTLPITAVLPALAESAVFTLRTSGYTKDAHNLHISAAEPAPTTTLLSWTGSGDHAASFSLDGRNQRLLVATRGGQAADGLLIDDLLWRRPVALRFGYTSATFETDGSAARLHLQQVAALSRLYDISDPLRPVRLLLDGQPTGTLLIESAGERRYLLLADEARLYLPWVAGLSGARSATLFSQNDPTPTAKSAPHPRLTLAAALDFTPALDVDALYVAPALYHAALRPLLDQRRSQGYRVALVDVADIYAGWSGGQVEPAAIREFVRWVTAKGSQPPQSLVLVGDGTSDPFNYTGRNNTNFVPPFLLPVDPWLGETACDSCFGQVDGSHPLDDSLPDVAVGRIPAKSAQEVAFYVEKLLAYERTPAALADRSRMLFVADNYRDASGRVDGAGDFTISAQTAVAQQPAGTQIERVYYDPSPTHTQDPWREPSAATAWRKTLAAFSRGAGFISYLGHAHHWQWASTDLNVAPPYLLGLYDADGLTNRGNLPILLEMSCLTGMFQQPAFSGTTIDERLLLHSSGGAAAIWSSTGFGVAYGHDALQRGFYQQFWHPQSSDRRLGALVQAGYLTLFSEGLCCQESLRTFVILGDPLTTPQAAAQSRVWMPRVGK